VALGALDAMRLGLHWVGCELEPRFVDLGQQNIDLWLARYAPHFPTWGTARLVQGDSRHLAQVLGDAGCCVTSPPYAESIQRPSGIDMDKVQSRYGPNCQAKIHDSYGTTPGQLDALPGGGFEAAVTSPPYAESANTRDTEFWHKHITDIGRDPATPGARSLIGEYGQTVGNLGNDTGATFWTAARAIVEQLYQVLRPGAPAVFVVKAFVRKGQRVDFPGQWRQLCAACGFAPWHEHRAWLVEGRGAQWGLDGELNERTVERKSFFRRLAERKGAPRIDWETVLCMRRV
jgi:hypothetical protein